MRRNAERLVLSCEHASRAIPSAYRKLFAGAASLLKAHDGSDIGSRAMGVHLARALDVDVIQAMASRLLVDCNRSPTHRQLFSDCTRALSEDKRAEILAQYYFPYREAVRKSVCKRIARRGQAVHVSVHSFTGTMDGKKRSADIGLLYDPARRAERLFCAEWQARLQAVSDFRVRRNYPYKGVSDGLVTHLRKQFPASAYIAIELEFNQTLVNGRHWRRLRHALAVTLAETLAALNN